MSDGKTYHPNEGGKLGSELRLHDGRDGNGGVGRWRSGCSEIELGVEELCALMKPVVNGTPGTRSWLGGSQELVGQ